MASKRFDCSFGTYEGQKRYSVMHPKFKNELIVRAPDENAAIMAAGNYWGEDWVDYDFYAYCEVFKV